MTFELTDRQREARAMLCGTQTHNMLFGGSRSGKTFVLVRSILVRALRAAGSRHAIMRFRQSHLMASIWYDTFPKVAQLCFPGLDYKTNKQEGFIRLPNGSEVWFGGLDEQDRVDKVLGQEHATIFLNECSQISYNARNTVVTRLAQSVEDAKGKKLPLKMYYDCNPPADNHWSCRLFRQGVDPDKRKPLRDVDNYTSMQMNPSHNQDNLPPGYIDTLKNLPDSMRRRFYDGEFGQSNPNALWTLEALDRWRATGGEMPDMQRVVVAVDPSGAGDDDLEAHDDIGICVAGLGVDGNAYLLEDLTCQLGPAGWGAVVASAYERHSADVAVAEQNFGGAMVEHVLRTADDRMNIKRITASRGKVVRAEPIAALYEKGKVRHVGYHSDLEDELCGFTTHGYTGGRSPNRADAAIWAISELFPGLTRSEQKWEPLQYDSRGIV